MIPFKVGDEAAITKRITSEDVLMFAEVSTDNNPIHLDDAFAAKTRFKKRIAHGIISAGLISAVIGTKLPGVGAIYLSQTLKFKAPVYLGDVITARAVVKAVREDKPIMTLQTICTNQDGVDVTEGEAVVMYDPPPEG
jgi:3-hydroxybutyryl-CoA dehydratase